MKKALLTFLVGVLVISIAGIAFAVDKEDKVKRSVVLPVEIKEPFLAEQLALTPIVGPLNAAKYVGTTRLRGEVDPGIASQARIHSLINLVTYIAGAYLALSNPKNTASVASGAFIFLFGASIENHFFFAPYYVDKAIEFNKRQYERFNWWTVPKFSD